MNAYALTNVIQKLGFSYGSVYCLLDQAHYGVARFAPRASHEPGQG